MPPPPAATLFDRLRDSDLLEPAQLEALAPLPEANSPDPRALGRVLVQRGLLTRFQVGLLAAGKAGELSLGAYRLLDRIGEGGMGAVYKARHLAMNRVVALKLIRREKLSSPDAVKRFYQEAQSAARLQHPNIVVAFDAGQVGTAHFLSMEYVPGTDLARLVKEKGPLPVARACEYVRQAALGLQHAHEQGMVHRDLKPHNLLLGRDARGGEVVKILDFGLARLSGPTGGDHALTQTGAVIGSPDFLAPEQALDSRSADVRSDLYSLGCTLYYLLAGRAPFHADALAQLLLKHQMEAPTPLGQVRADVTPGLDAVVMKLLAKRPEDRYQTPADLAAALEPFARGGDAPVPEVVAAPASPEVMGESWAAITEEAGKDRAARGSRSGSRDGTVVAAGGASGPRSKRGMKGKAEAKEEPAGPARKLPVLVLAGVGVAALVLLVGGGTAAVVLLNALKPATPTVVEDGNPTSLIPPTTTPTTKPKGPEGPDFVDPGQNPNPPTPNPMPGIPVAEPPPGQELFRLRPLDKTTAIVAAEFCPDGRRIVGITRGGCYFWDAALGERGNGWNTGWGGRHLAVLPDGRRIVTDAPDGQVVVWDMETGKEVHRIKAHSTPIRWLDVSADGRRLITAAGRSVVEDGKVAVKNGEEVRIDLAIRVWDVETGQEVQKFEGFKRPTTKGWLSADGRWALTFGHTPESVSMVVMWDTATGREIRRVGKTVRFGKIELCPDGRHMLHSPGLTSLVLWDIEADKDVRNVALGSSGTVNAMAVSPDGRYALVSLYKPPEKGSNVLSRAALLLCDLTTGQLVREVGTIDKGVNRLAFSPDGRRAVSVSSDQTCRVWDLGVSDPPGGNPGGPNPVGAGSRPAVPEDAKLTQAEKLLKELFKDDYARTKPADKQALAAKFLEKAAATKDDPASRFVMLREAREIGSGVGDAKTVLAAVAELERWYAVDGVEMRLTSLAATAKALTAAVQARALIEGTLDAADVAVKADDHDTALKFVGVAADAAKKLKVASLETRVANIDKDLRETQKEWERVKAAREALKERADDTEANLTVGRYLCFRKGDWDKGLPHLALSGQESLSAVAKRDQGMPADPAAQEKVADEWWKLAEAEKGLAKMSYMRRAAYWYRLAAPGLTGLQAERVNGLLQKIGEAEAAFYPPEKGPAPVRLVGHAGPVNCVNFSPDNKRVITGSDDRLAKVWDVGAATLLVSLAETESAVGAVMLVGDKGQFAAVGGTDGWLRWWDLEKDARRSKSNGGYEKPFVGMSTSGEDGFMVVGAKDGWPICGDWKDGAQAFTRSLFKPPSLRSVAVAGEGHVAVGDGGGDVYLIDSRERREFLRFTAHKGAVVAVAADGKTCVTAGADKVVAVWDLSKPGKADLVRQLHGHAGAVNCVAVLADGKRILTGGDDKTVRLWETSTGRELMRFTGHADKVNAMAVSFDGQRAVTGGADKLALLWDLSKAP